MSFFLLRINALILPLDIPFNRAEYNSFAKDSIYFSHYYVNKTICQAAAAAAAAGNCCG